MSRHKGTGIKYETLLYVKAHQKVSSMEETLNNEGDKMTWPVDDS